MESVRRRRVEGRDVALKGVVGISDPDQFVTEATEVIAIVGKKFRVVWKSGNIDVWLRVQDYVVSNEGCDIGITEDEVGAVVGRIARRTIKDAAGLCVGALRLVFEAHKPLLVTALNAALASTAVMSSYTISGKVYGKKTPTPTSKQLRAILPLLAALQIFDVILAGRLETYMDESLQPARNLHTGARRGTQTLEIAQSMSLVLEKSADSRSRGASAQYDIETYCDTIPVMMVVRDMQRIGAAASLMAAVGRQQLCVAVRLTVVCDLYAAIPRRTSGALTGSRVMGQLGRWPVEMSTLAAMRDPSVRGWTMPNDQKLLYDSYADNLYGLADSSFRLVHNMRILELQLLQRWHLRMKPGSAHAQMVVCRGTADVARDYDGDDDAGSHWLVCGLPTHHTMNVLGHHVPGECLATFLGDDFELGDAKVADVVPFEGLEHCSVAGADVQDAAIAMGGYDRYFSRPTAAADALGDPASQAVPVRGDQCLRETLRSHGRQTAGLFRSVEHAVRDPVGELGCACATPAWSALGRRRRLPNGDEAARPGAQAVGRRSRRSELARGAIAAP